MSGTNSPQGGLTRRSFLKTTAAVAGATALAGGASLTALADGEVNNAATEQVFVGACRGNCCGGCTLDLTVRDGRLVKTYYHELPDEEYNHRLCLKGLSHAQRVYSEQRLKYPMKRVEGTERGAGEWERITWDEALSIIVEKWTAYRDEYGPESILFYSSAGNFASVNGSDAMWPANVMGMSRTNNSYDMVLAGASVNAMGLSSMYSSNELADIANAKTVIAWGADVCDSYLQSWRFFADAKENGATLVVIDPLYTTLASKAHKYVPIRPASDAALAMSMMKVIMDEGLTDDNFIASSTVGPFLVRADNGKYLRGSDTGVKPISLGIDAATGTESFNDRQMVWDKAAGKAVPVDEAVMPAIEGTYTVSGIEVTTAYSLLKERVSEWTPEKAQDVCDVPAETIYELARLYATNTPSTIFCGFGIDHYVNAEYSLFSVMTLSMITGNLGKPGATCGLCQPLGMDWCDSSVFNMGGPGSWGTITNLKLAEVLKTGEYAGRPITIKSMFAKCGNLGNKSNYRETMEEIIPNIEFIVVCDMIMTDLGQYADIVLPAAHWFEVNDVFGKYSPQPYLVIQEKAIEPYFESKSDFDIGKLITQAMGAGEAYWNLSDLDYMDLMFQGAGAQAMGLSLERLQKEKVIRLWKKFAIHGEGGVFPTATGRAQFYFETPAPNTDFGQEWDEDKAKLPILFEEPIEAWETNPLHEKYPFVYIQQHSKWRTHTQFGEIPWLRELDPEPTVKMNPDDAASRGISDGDTVRVFNDRGYVVLKAVISNGIRPGCVNVAKGWQAHHFIEGHYQSLTSGETSMVYVNMPFYDVLVDVEKYDAAGGEQ